MKQEPTNRCPKCGAPLPPDAPQGLCPRCIGAFDFNEETVGPGPPAAPKPPPSPEDIAPHFPQLEILECLGRGGMGVVYKARQKALGRPVALKILAPERENDPEFAARFTREAQALARLSHPHIVTVHDFGQADGYFYLLMEFVDGVNLRQAMRARRFTPEQALAVVPQICEALQFAHDRGIVHRDIKPENILLDRQGFVKIADFGVAKIFGREAPPAADTGEPGGDLTSGKGVVGTPRYMAPEQVAHPLDVDHRADIYSLGVVFYEMLTGELPASSIEPPSKKVLVDVRLDEVVLRALEKEPARRYQRAGEVGTMVETIATTSAGTHAPARKSGMVRIMEIFFDITFTSPWAIRCLNASALGFFGFLSALRFLEIDQLRWTSGFSGLFGLFGLIGVAFIIEMVARGKGGPCSAPSESGAPPVRSVADAAMQQVKGPAIGLVVAGTLNWILIPLITMMIMAYRAIDLSGQPAFWVVPIAALVLCSLTIFGALKMKHLESYGWAITAAILAILVSPGNIIGLPLGIWALAVLGRSDVRAAFRRRSPAVAPKRPGLSLVVNREGRRAIQWPVAWIALLQIGLIVALLWVIGAGKSIVGLIAVALVLKLAVSVLRGWTMPLDQLTKAGSQTVIGVRRGGADWLPTILVAVVIALVLRAWIVAPYYVITDSVAPEVPKKSFVLVNKLARSFSAGDIIVFREGGRAKLARVTQPGPKKGLLEISRGKEGPVLLQMTQARGKVILNTRPGPGPETFSPGTNSQPASQESPGPGITRVTVEAGRATVEGRANADSQFIVAVGEGQTGCAFINDLPFTATVEPADWGRGFACVVKDSIGNMLLTLGRIRIGPMTYERGRIVLRDGTPAPEADGAYVIGEFRPANGPPAPFSVALKNRGKAPMARGSDASGAPADDGSQREVAKIRLGLAEGELKRAEALFKAGQLEPLAYYKAKFDFELAAAEMKGDAVDIARAHLEHAEEVSKLQKLRYESGIVGVGEYEKAKADLEIAKLGWIAATNRASGTATIPGQSQPASATAPADLGANRSAAKGRDNVLVEDLAIRLLAAIRDKEDAVLKDLATDRILGWREALPQFAFELRERYTHLTGKPFGVFPEDSLVVGDFAVVRCTGPAELQGKCLVLGFVRTPDGWRNWTFRNSTKDVPLRRHLDDFKNAK